MGQGSWRTVPHPMLTAAPAFKICLAVCPSWLQPFEAFILLPVAEEHCVGGEASNTALTEALQQALRPFLKKPEEGSEEAGQAAAGPGSSLDVRPPSLAAEGSGAPPKLFAGASVDLMRDV